MSARQRSCGSLPQHLTTYTKLPDSHNSIFFLYTLNSLRTRIESSSYCLLGSEDRGGATVQDTLPIQNYGAAVYVWM